MPTAPVTFNQINENVHKIGPLFNDKPIEEVIATSIALAYVVQYAMMSPDQFDEALRETSSFISNKIANFIAATPPTPPEQVN